MCPVDRVTKRWWEQKVLRFSGVRGYKETETEGTAESVWTED